MDTSPVYSFTEPVATILSRHRTAQLTLTRSTPCDRESAAMLTTVRAGSLFPQARNAEAAVSGLLLLLGCWEESHGIAQDIASREGSYWHAIAHRMEPDAWNSGYWFRRVGQHPIFTSLRSRAVEILQAHKNTGWQIGPAWDPLHFIEWCEEARTQPGTKNERTAREIQQAEWQLLFHWCATAA